MGSSRDARIAGTMPKNTPTPAEKPMPMANDHQGSETGKPVSQCTDMPMPLPMAMPSSAADRGHEDRLEQELPQDLDAPCAERLAHADFARALGDADRHDAHDADAADHQRNRRQHDEREERRLADLIPDLQQRVLRHEVEVVRLVEAQAVPDAHDLLDLVHRLFTRHALARHRADDDGAHLAAAEVRGAHPEVLLVRRLRDDGEVVGADVEPAR